MKASLAAKISKWASLAVVCALLLSACGTKPAPDQGKTSAGQPTASQPPATQASPQPQTKKSWSSPPEMKIDQNKTYQATVTTSKGTFKIDLFAKEAPKTVNNFVFLSKEGFYNNVVFHRIIQSFMVQTGDPEGTGRGGPGYKFEDELKTSHQYEPGIVAMANAGSNTNGSQFFICTGEDSKNLNKTPNYTIFGKVSEGMDVVQQIAATPVESNGREVSKPTEKVTIQSIDITEK
ncbi:peptidylprolyl isomerase [Paenibacillus sp. 32352]|uniref:peptidylprolyl isomerase n=1 Tax=Paenibacillus sp. 32352 TaxID=1969111 RepID=UPI0009AD1A24|nr:peptidylprolyl isomerase [Paenibacillus sp. 32352]